MKEYIKGFDGLRGISILLVLLTHLGMYHHLPNNNFIRQRVWYLFSGTTGVNIFFVISGFLITLILLKEIESRKKINYKNFFARRFLRLLPPLLVFYSIVILLMATHQLPQNYLSIVISFFYLYNFAPQFFYIGELGHTWSLAVEEQFYLIWPFLLNYAYKKKKMIFVVIVFIILSVIAKLFIHNLYIPFEYKNKIHSLIQFGGFRTERWFFPAVAPIMIGAGISILTFTNKLKFEKHLKKNKLTLLLSIILFISALYLPISMLRLTFIIQAFGVSLFLAWIYFNQNTLLSKILEFKPLSFIGKISYGLYVYQGLFLRTGPSGKLSIQQFPLNIFLTFVVAIISYFLIEKRILKLKSKFM